MTERRTNPRETSTTFKLVVAAAVFDLLSVGTLGYLNYQGYTKLTDVAPYVGAAVSLEAIAFAAIFLKRRIEDRSLDAAIKKMFGD